MGFFSHYLFVMEEDTTKRKREDGDEEDIDVEDFEEDLPDGKKEDATELIDETDESHFKRRDDTENVNMNASEAALPESIERTEVFEIKTDHTLLEQRFSASDRKPFTIFHKDFQLSFIDDIDRMQKAGYCDEEKVLALWEQKSRYSM